MNESLLGLFADYIVNRKSLMERESLVLDVLIDIMLLSVAINRGNQLMKVCDNDGSH